VASRIQAETELIAARQELAVAVGVSTSSLLLAPLPGDDFPLPPGGEAIPGEKALIAVTLQMRDDLRAARQTVESRKVLLDASYLNLRPTVNLELLAAYTPFETRDQTFVTRGSEWQAGAALRLDWPIANNTAMGAYIQSQASLHGSRITLEEMERSAISQVITSLAQLKGAAVNMKLYGDAARWYKEALIAQEELFALGHGTLTDTITARQRLVEAQVNYVVARQNYATALVFLRFTTGTLLFSDEQGSWIDPDTWKIVPFQASTSPAKGKGKRSAR